MGWMPSEQPCESKKAPISRAATLARSGAVLRNTMRPLGARAEGTLWKRRMRTLAMRITKGQFWRHSSGALMKHHK